MNSVNQNNNFSNKHNFAAVEYTMLKSIVSTASASKKAHKSPIESNSIDKSNVVDLFFKNPVSNSEHAQLSFTARIFIYFNFSGLLKTFCFKEIHLITAQRIDHYVKELLLSDVEDPLVKTKIEKHYLSRWHVTPKWDSISKAKEDVDSVQDCFKIETMKFRACELQNIIKSYERDLSDATTELFMIQQILKASKNY